MSTGESGSGAPAVPSSTPSTSAALSAPRRPSGMTSRVSVGVAGAGAGAGAPRRAAGSTTDHLIGRTDSAVAPRAATRALLSTPVHSSRGSGSYSPSQAVGEQPPISYWRPTEPHDLPRILDLAKADVMSIYGEAEDIASILERSVLAVSQLNVREELVACLCLSNWPPSPGVHPSASPEWLNLLYDLRLGPASTLQVRLLLWDDRYGLTCARLLLHSVFVTLPALEQLVLVVPAKTPKNDVLWTLFDEELAKGFKTAGNLQSLLVCRREFFMRKLRLRPAVCEDNDDLLRIFDQKAYCLRHLYGDFYITELISNPESRKIIVAEGPQRKMKVKQAWEMRVPVIGVMVLDSDVNLPLLNAHFQLLPFYGLRQPHARDVLNLAGWVKPRPEMAEALNASPQDADASDGPATVEEDSSSSRTSTEPPRRVEGLAARAARLREEALERKRRRWTGDDEHYLSALSLTEEERHEPEDPYRLADVTWANVLAGTESSSLSTESDESDEDRIFRFRRKKKVRVRTRSDMMVATTGVIELLPEFRGPPNAFLVELFAMDQLFDERLALDFLAEAFRLFPGLDYCTLALPHAYPTFPLLDHFVRVAPRERRNFHQELYVAHRSAVLGELLVREAVPGDLQDVLQLIRTLKRSLGLVLREVQAALDAEGEHSSWLRAYVACWQDQVVGLAIISDEDDWEYMACHYMVGRFADVSLLDESDHGGLRVCLLSPVFQQRAGLFLRELHRLSAKTLLYYTLYPCADLWRVEDKTAREEAAELAGHPCPRFLHKQAPAAAVEPASLPCLPVPSVLDELMPVAPRPPPNGLHHVTAERPEEGEEMPASERREAPYALLLSTPRLVALPKATVNVRVVVVGASDTALSFLETLVFSAPEVRYNNVTLVSKHGLPGETDLGPLADHFLPHRGRYDYRQMARLQLGAWVNVVTGMVTKIHRAERIVEVDGKSALPYDYLFLFCGQQFCLPQFDAEGDLPCKHYPTGKGWPASIGAAEPASVRMMAPREDDDGAAEEEAERSSEDMSSSAAETLNDTTTGDQAEQAEPQPAQPDREGMPANVFLLNGDVDVRDALLFLHRAASNSDGEYKVVLYGSWECPELLCCAAGLLHWGVSAGDLLIVDPNSPIQEGPRLPSCFGEEEVEAAVLASLEASGVALSRGCELDGWIRGEPDWLLQLREDGIAGVGQDAAFATHVRFKPKQGAKLGRLHDLVRKKDSEETLDEMAPLPIPCLAMFAFQQRSIHPVTFAALVDSGLVMDGLLVIDRLGRTNDPFIQGGGSVTTYQRRLGAADMDHPYYSGLEIGRKMAARMQQLWDPVLKAREHVQAPSPSSTAASSARSSRSHSTALRPTNPLLIATKSEGIGEAVRAVMGPYWHYVEMVPTLTAPVVLGCALPAPGGELHFLRVRSPGPFPLLPGEVRPLQAGKPGDDRFCRLFVDAEGFVRGVDCLARQPIPVDMLVAAYGQHEDGLGNVADILNVLLSPTVMGAVYHRDPYKTAQWQLDMDAIFGFPSCKLVPAVLAALKSNDMEPLDSATCVKLRQQWSESGEQRAIENRVARLLRDHGINAFSHEVREAVYELLQSKEGWKGNPQQRRCDAAK